MSSTHSPSEAARQVFGLDEEEPRGFDVEAWRIRAGNALLASLGNKGKPLERKLKASTLAGPDPELTGVDPNPSTKQDFNDAAKNWMRRQGWIFERTDYYDARTGRHHDLFGMFDYVAFNGAQTIGVQITSKANMSARKKKMLANPLVQTLLRAGWKIVVLGFYKESDRWQAREESIT